MLRRLLPFSVVALVLAMSGPAFAHEERASQFPSGKGSTPTYRTYQQAADRLVVCKPTSRAAIARIRDAKLRAFNNKLLGQCRFQHLQAAVDAVRRQRTNIYVLPGLYREEPSWAPACTKAYTGGIVEYPLVVSCGEVTNLVTVAGDSPQDADRVCDNALCRLQIEGTGERREDVVLRGGFTKSGDWVKHNGIKADRADGFYLRNLTAELFKENALYVHETDGYVLDEVNARHNDLYGILTFTSDHGLIEDCDASFNGDSGVYPGSAADVNKDSTVTGPLTRYAVEIRRCNTHHNALGFSGTAGNSVWFHDNEVHDNSAGYVTDSFVGGHPGMPQDHAWLTHNRIYRNNSNYVERFVHSGICARVPGKRGYGAGTVCPVFPVPVGTGVMIAGGNRNFVDANQIYDNWRSGVMLFWVPGALRDDTSLAAQYDTSNGNHFTRNLLGRHPSGVVQPNGTDFWWDEQGIGNCWEGNRSAPAAVTSNYPLPVGLPTCSGGGSLLPVGNPAKSATLVPCARYNREDEPDPVGCDWFDSPARPADRQAARGEPPVVAAADGWRVGDLTGLVAAVPPVSGGSGPGAGATALVGLVAMVLIARVLPRPLRRRWS
ncbi:MAG TPA: right-handed parallel beta-helix repeat-containing protein [Mycobacteriales bacterium]|nr:right-handed parallel beta-helix repeat-containing protein [Mycobacteriales bacterium]